MMRMTLPVVLALVALPGAGAQRLADASPASGLAAPGQSRPAMAARESVLDQRITLRLGEVPLRVAVQEIARAAALGFVHGELLPARRTVRVQLTDVRVGDALAEVLRGTGLVYEFAPASRMLVLHAPAREEAGRIVGRVVQSVTREPLPDVQIVLEGTNRGTRTTDKGDFVLADVPAGTYTVSARKVGLARAAQRVTVRGDTTVQLELALASTVSRLDEVVVTSTISETQVRQVPVDVTVITDADIRARNITNVQQLFRGDIPGVFMEDRGFRNLDPFSESTPQVRGQNFLSASPNSPSFLKVYLDGVLVDYAIVAQLDATNIERIEVVRGPAATTMYGSGASDGVMQIFTKRGTLGSRPRATLGLSTQMYDSPYVENIVMSPRVELGLSGGADAFSYNARASLARQGAWVPTYKAQTRNLSLGVRWDNGPFTLSANVQYDGPNEYVSPPDPFYALGLLEDRFSRARISASQLVPKNTIGMMQVQTMGTTATFRATPTWNHTLTVGVMNRSSESWGDRPAYTHPSDTLVNIYGSTNTTNTLRYVNTWVAGITPRLRSNLTTGVEYTSTRYNSFTAMNTARTQGSLNPTLSGLGRQLLRNTGYFAQWELGIADALFLTTGMRAEQNPDYGRDVGMRYAPRFGATYVIDVGDVSIKPRVSYGWANRPPQPQQKDAGPTTTTVSGTTTRYTHTLANPDLRPSESRGGDYGVDVSLGNWLSLSATYFRQLSDNDIYRITTVDTADNVPPPAMEIHTSYQYINIGKVRSTGVELRARAAWQEWSVVSTYSTASNIVLTLPPGVTSVPNTQAKLRVGSRLEHVPKYRSTTTLGYTRARTNLNVSAIMQGRYRAADIASSYDYSYGTPDVARPPTIERREVLMPRWVKYDVNGTQQVWRNVEAFIRVQNLFNSRRTEGYDNLTPLSGRVVTLGTRISN